MYLAFANLITTGFLCVIWSKDGWHNFALKFLFLGLAAWNLLNVAITLGYAVHVG